MSPRAKVQAGGILRKAADQTWRTPEFVLDHVRSYFGGQIPFDPATATSNPTKALRFCAGPEGTLFARDSLESRSGLEVDWLEHGPWWVNPPFQRAWIEKIGREGEQGEGVALLPCNRFEEPYLQSVLRVTSAICLVDAAPFQKGLKGNKHRIAFLSSLDGQACGANPFASMILGFRTDALAFVDAFGPLGLCIEPAVIERRGT